MSNVLLALLSAMLCHSAASQLTETFDDSSKFSCSCEFFSDGGSDYFGLTNPNVGPLADSPPSIRPFDGVDGMYLIGEDLDAEGCDLPITCTWAGLTASEMFEVSMKFGATEGKVDLEDHVSLSYSVDGGSPQPIFVIRGWDATNNDGFNGQFFLDANMDGSISSEEIAMGPYTQSMRDITFSDLPGSGSTMDLILEININSGDEEVAFDSLMIEPATTTTTPTPCQVATPQFCSTLNRMPCTVGETCGTCVEGFNGEAGSNDACVPKEGPSMASVDGDVVIKVDDGQSIKFQVGTTTYDLSSMMSMITSLSAEVATLRETTKTDLMSIRSDVNTDLASVKSDVTSIQGQLPSLGTTDTMLSEQITTLQQNVSDLQSSKQEKIKNGCSDGETVATVMDDGTIVCRTAFTPNFGEIQKRIATTCGAGEFVVGIQENGDPLCESPFDTVIEDISGDGWSDTKTIEQQPFGQIHGPFGGDVQSISKEYTTLADHCELEITLRYWAIDSWDAGEKAWIKVDNEIVFEDLRYYTSGDFDLCKYEWSNYEGELPNPWVGSDNNEEKCYQDITLFVPHSGSLKLEIGSTIGSTIADESWAFSNLRIATVSDCPKRTYTLPNDVADHRWSNPMLLTGVDNSLGVVHGRFVTNDAVRRTYTLHQYPHCKVQIKARFWAIDSWDAGEYARLFVDGNQVWAERRYISGDDYVACRHGWQGYDGFFPNPWTDDGQKCYWDINMQVDHTADTMTLEFRVNLNSPGDDESWAFSALEIQTLPC